MFASRSGIRRRNATRPEERSMKDRVRNLVVRLDDAELAMAHRLSEAQDEPVARLVRKWIRQHYEASFGSTEATATKAARGRT